MKKLENQLYRFGVLYWYINIHVLFSAKAILVEL